MRRYLPVVIGALLLCACPSPKPAACGPGNCSGCCTAEGQCDVSAGEAACGLGGLACASCAAGEGCLLGFCVPAANPGPDAGDAGSGTDGGGADGGTDGGGGDGGIDCFDDTDCPDLTLFVCNTTTSRCEPSCRNQAGCTAAVRGPYALDFCDGGLGCQCDEGACVPARCSSDSDCGSQACRGGACVPFPAAASVARCEVSPDFLVVRTGAKARFFVSAWDSAGQPTTVASGITWSPVGSLMTGTGTGASAEFTAGAVTVATGPADSVQVQVGPANCRAKVLVLPNPSPANRLDAVATDEMTGRPISGATVLLSNPTTGAAIGAAATTDANGFAEFTVPGGTTVVSATVFYADYDYLTLAGYDLATASPDAKLLSFVLRRNSLDRYGGLKGALTGIPQSSMVHFGYAGTSQPVFHERALVGPDVNTHVVVGSAIDQDMLLPAPVAMGFTDTMWKPAYSALGLAGVCRTGGVTDEAATRSGACGTAAGWALSGDVPLGDLPIDLFAGGAVDMAKVLLRVSGTYKRLGSSVVRDVRFGLLPAPLKTDGGTPDQDVSDTTGFAAADQAFAQVPLAFNFAVKPPDLVSFGADFPDVVLVRGLAMVPGRGLVQLGLGSGVNTAPRDAKVDAQGLLAAGLVPVRMAPNHDGTEGSEYVLTVTATYGSEIGGFGFGGGSGATSFEHATGVVGRLPQNRLVFDPTGTAPVAVGGAFLKLPLGARYNFTNVASGALPARTFRFTVAPGLPAGTVVRVAFTDRAAHRWMVEFDPAVAPAGFTLPVPPGAFGDRTFWDGSGARSSLLVQALSLSDGAPVTFRRLIELNSTNADRLQEFTTAFSLVDYSRPTVAWVVPAASGVVLPAGSAVKVKVGHFQVGSTVADDGFVRVTFTGGSASCTAVDGKVMATGGTGEVSLLLPLGCAGATVQMTAALVDPAGAPLAPAVSQGTTVSIN